MKFLARFWWKFVIGSPFLMPGQRRAARKWLIETEKKDGE